MFALSERRIGPEEAGRILNVDYIVSGSLRRQDNRLRVSVELAGDAQRPHRLGRSVRSEDR